VQEVVEELPLELQELLAREQPPVGVTERAGVVERPGVALAVDRQLRVVDVPGEFGLVLVFLVLRLERLHALPFVLGRDQPDHLDVVLQDGLEVVVVVGEKRVQVELRRGIERLVVSDRVGGVESLVEPLDDAVALGLRQQHQRILVHRGDNGIVFGVLVADDVAEVGPPERVHPPGVGRGVVLEVPPDHPIEVRLPRPDRAQEELDPFLRPQAPGAGFHLVYELVDRLVDLPSVEGVLAAVKRVLRGHPVLDHAGVLVVVGPVVVEHVRDALVGVPGDPGVLVHRVQIPLEGLRFPEVLGH